MKYTQLIEKRKQYKYSANICFDLENEDRLSGFIPNVTTTEILREYLYGIIQKGDIHSRILYGSYGTGKSHLLTVLSALLGHINTDGKAFDVFINSIEHYDKEFAKDIKVYVSEDKPYMVVPIYSDFSDFDRCISFSLKKEMEKLGYEICFRNYFHEALELLENWETGQDSSTRLNQILDELKIDINKLKNSLANFEALSEKMFGEVFKMMTYGASFVSGAGNLIDNLNQANQIITGDYKGIVFVFDEFGRYIEDNSESIKVKIIQDFAEYCDHTDYDNHLILVSHKQLSLYTDKMKKSLSDEWKKIEGRFKSTSINIKYDQCLSLIPHIIPKTDKWDGFRVKYSEELNCLYEQAWDFKGFLLPPEGGNPFEGGYPLHPITLYALDRLSKKVAQNERTFFTYLASDEKNSLFSQLTNLKDDRFHFIGLDYIYDYFEENIMSFRANDIYLVYKKLQYAINKLGDAQNLTEIRILKAMAVINIISDTAILSSNRNTLCHVIDEDDAGIIRAIEKLELKKIIKYMRQYGFYDFLDSSIYDLDSLIEERIPAISDDMVTTILNDEFASFAIYPNDYNFRYHMNRILVPVFAYRTDLSKKSFLKSLPTYYDGIIAFILDRNYEIKEYTIDAGIPERAICLINTLPEAMENEVKRYISVKYYYAKREELKKDDPTVEKELLLYLEEERAILNDLIDNWKNMMDKNIVSIVCGEQRNISSALELTIVASEVVEKAFPKTIIVNNDLINKNIISGAIKLARAKALEYIMGDEDDILKDCTPLSPEHTIIRSVLVKNGLYDDETNAVLNILPDGEHSGAAVRKEISDYLKRAKKTPTSLMEIYKKLKQPPYGLRDGYLPILLAFEMKKHENVSISFHGADRDYCIDEFIKAFENPEDYSIYICNWNKKQREYIEGVEALFGGYRNSKSKSRLKDLLNAMNTHFAGVSKSARTTEKFVSKKTKLYRDIMSVSYKDYNAFFFEVLPQINGDLSELSYELGVIKNELENVSKLQLAEVDRIIRKVFDITDESLIVDYFARKYEDDWSQKEHKVFDYQTNAMIEYLKTFNQANEDNKFIDELAQVITGFEIAYWNDSKMDDLYDTLARIRTQLENFEVKESLEDNEVKIIIQAGNENLRSTQFDKQELSRNGQVMLNKMKSTLENFGQSLSQEEKMQIITRLLEEIM
ncbi:MAG: hypothetical protein HDR15_08815 [Lachnospiraceae bacterium]|nr:hypothetical protein [Lachnospiraceae bacterium]